MAKIPQRARQVVRHPVRAARWAVSGAQATLAAQLMRERGIEVWQWTKPKYRVRAIVLLLLNAALFAGLGCFTFWLRTGEYSVFTANNYWATWREAFSTTREPPVTLVSFLTYPIPVDQVPLMLVIVGLVLASLTAIPILVSMLYRFPYALIFTLIICFVAVVPWLAITVTFCCFLARWKPLRFSFHYATALISLVPLVAYYALATSGPTVFSLSSPFEMAKFYLPWVIALIGACVLMAIVLSIARLVNYRPGAIAPSMALMFAVPVLLFERQVGQDELYYRLLEVQYGPRSTEYFVDYADATPVIERLSERRFLQARATDPRATLESAREQVRLLFEFQLSRIRPELEQQSTLDQEQFATDQHVAQVACDEFLRKYPQSRYVPNVLYIKGRVSDLRVDEAYFRQTAILRHYSDFPRDASMDTWQRLYHYESSPLWIVAAHRVALLEARQGDMDAAIRTLERLFRWYGTLDRQQATQPAPEAWPSFFAKRPPSRLLEVDPAAVALEGSKLQSLILNNRDPQQRDLPLQRLLRMNPRHPLYQANLRRMLEDIPSLYPLTPLRDNVRVLIANAAAGTSHSRRIELLKACVEEFSRDAHSDALPMARFALGTAYKDDSRLADARAIWEEMVRDAADSPWKQEAKQQLAAMGVGRFGN